MKNPSRSLIPWAVRSHRTGVAATGLSFGALIAVSAPAYLAAANAVSGGLQSLAAQATPLAKTFTFLTGPVDRLDTIGGYLSYKVLSVVVLLVAIYATVQGSQIARGSESRGLFDIWYASGLTRLSILGDRVVAAVIALFAIACLLYIATVVGGAATGENFAIAGLGQSTAIWLVAVSALGLGLLLGQFFGSTRTVSGIAAGYLVAAYFVANLSGSLGIAEPLRFLSPFYYYLQARTLIPGHTFDVGAAALLAGAASALIAAAFAVFVRRDIGDVAITHPQRERPTDRRFVPTRVWGRTLALNAIAEQRIALVAWFLGIALFSGIQAGVAPTAIRLVNDSTGPLGKLLAERGGGLTTDRYIGFILSFAALFIAGFVVTQVARWASDATHHRIDAVLVQPVSVARLVAERGLGLVITVALMAAAVVVGLESGSALRGYRIDGAGMVRTFATLLLLGCAIGGIGLVALSITRRALATGITGAILVASWFISTLTALLAWPAWTSAASVFQAFGNPYAALPATLNVVYLGALGVGGAALAYLLMRTRDRVIA